MLHNKKSCSKVSRLFSKFYFEFAHETLIKTRIRLMHVLTKIRDFVIDKKHFRNLKDKNSIHVCAASTL